MGMANGEGTLIVVAGGVDAGGLPHDEVFVYNVTNGTWSTKKGLFAPRSSFGAAWAMDYNDDGAGVASLFALGGNSGKDPAIDVLEVMNPEF